MSKMRTTLLAGVALLALAFVAAALGDDIRESERRSRWGRLELQHQLGRQRRDRDGHRNLDRNGWRVHLDCNQHVAADCNLDGVGAPVNLRGSNRRRR